MPNQHVLSADQLSDARFDKMCGRYSRSATCGSVASVTKATIRVWPLCLAYLCSISAKMCCIRQAVTNYRSGHREANHSHQFWRWGGFGGRPKSTPSVISHQIAQISNQIEGSHLYTPRSGTISVSIRSSIQIPKRNHYFVGDSLQNRP